MADVYKVGMEIALTGGLSSALAGIMGQLGGMHGRVKEIEKGLRGWNAALIGVGFVAAGAAVLTGANKIEEAGEKLAHAKEMLSLGKTPEDMARLTSAAWAETGRNLRTTITGNVEALQDLYNVLLNTDHAIAALPAFNIMKNALDSASGKGADIGDAASSRNIGNAVRAFELEGRTSEADLTRMSADFTKAILALPGRIDGTAYNTQVANSGSARMGWDDEFATAGVPALMNVLKGKTGTSLNALGNNIADGLSSSILQMAEQIKYGLQTDANRLDPDGKKPGFAPGSAFEASKLRSDPISWANDYRALLKGEGVNVDDKQEMMTVVASIARGNKLLKAALDELLLPASNAQINKEYKRILGMPGDGVTDINAKDPEAVRQALHAQFNSTVEAFGEQLSKTLIPVMQKATEILSTMNQWIGAHPEETEKIGKAVLALGAVLIAAGTIAVAVGLISFAPMIAAVAAIGAVIAAIAAYKWDAVSSFFSKLGKILGATVEAGSNDARAVANRLQNVTPSGAFGGAFPSLSQGFAAIFPSLSSFAKALPPPQVKSDVKVDTKVYVDASEVAAKVETQITKNNRAVTGASDHDNSAAWAPPDMGMGP